MIAFAKFQGHMTLGIWN